MENVLKSVTGDQSTVEQALLAWCRKTTEG